MSARQRAIPARASILDAAQRLFTISGFHQTPMAKLALEAKVSVGLIYREFTDKEELIVEISRLDMEARVCEIDFAIEEVSSEDRPLCQGLSRYIERSTIHAVGSLSYDILAEARRNPIVAAHVGKVQERLRALILALMPLAEPAVPHDMVLRVEEAMVRLLLALSYQALPSAPLSAATEIAQFIIQSLQQGDVTS